VNKEEKPVQQADLTTEEQQALEQAELRKRAADKVAEQAAHRTGPEKTAEPVHHGPEPEWKPPKELSAMAGSGTVVLRFLIFLLLMGGLYFLLSQSSRIFFQPSLQALGVVVPSGRLAPGQPVTLAVRVNNRTRYAGAASVVAVLPSGQEVNGTPVEVPGNDSALVSVEVRLPPGDHVLSLVALDAGGVNRLESYHGLSVWVGDREIDLQGVSLPAQIARADTLVVDFLATNPGQAAETVIPVFVFTSAEGAIIEIDGPVAEIPAGEEGPLQVTVLGEMLQPGRYSVGVMARTPDGQRLALEGPMPVEVTN